MIEKPPPQALVYFKTDKDGYLINDFELKPIRKSFPEIFNEIEKSLPEKFGNNFCSLYVAARVIKDSLKLRILIILKNEQPIEWLKDYRNSLARFKYIKDIGVNLETYNFVLNNERAKFRIKTEYELLCGEDLGKNIKRYKPSSDLCFHLQIISTQLDDAIQRISDLQNEAKIISRTCQEAMRIILLSGFELCINKEKKYTKDLYTCYRTFAKYYPDKEIFMRKAYYLLHKPTKDYNELIEFLSGFGKWLVYVSKMNESDEYLIK